MKDDKSSLWMLVLSKKMTLNRNQISLNFYHCLYPKILYPIYLKTEDHKAISKNYLYSLKI
jgi:hypothetical protein